MRKFLCFSILLLSIHFAKAQYQINGLVKNSNAIIYLSEANKTAITDSSGIFRFNNISEGFYSIEIKSIGYKTLFIELAIPFDESKHKKVDGISINQNEKTISIDIQLEKSQIEMKEIVVSGTRNSLQNNSTINIDVANMNELFELGQITVMEVLATKPGVSLISTGPGIARPVIRGLTGNRIATIINGIKLENQQWDMEHTLGLNQYGIDRIEIIKGPATFLYGSDAMGGVLNFIDEKPAAINTIIGDITAGFNSNTFGTTTAIGVKGAKEHSNWSLRAGLNNSSDYYNANFDRVANSRFREVFGKATYSLNYKRSVTLFSYQLNFGYYGIVEPFEKKSATETEDHPMEFETPYHTLIHQTALVKNTLLFGKTNLISTVSFQNDQRMELEPGNTETNPFLGINLNVISGDVKADHNFNKHIELVGGAQISYQQNTNNGYSRLIPNYSQSDIGIYALNKYRLAKNKLNIDIGARYDKRDINSETSGIKDSADYMQALSKNYENMSTSFGVNYLLSNNISIYGNVGSGFRAPNMAELTSNGKRLETQRYEVGNNTFLKETNLQGEIGLHSEFNDFSIEGSAFYNHINNFIYTQRRGDTLSAMPVYEFKQADAWIFGGEAGIDIHPATLKWLDLRSTYSQLEGHLNDGTYLPFMPQNKLNNEIVLRGKVFTKINNSFMRVGYNYVFAQNNVAVNEFTTPAYNIVNLSFGGVVKMFKQKFIIAVGINNLLNELYYDHLSRLRPYGVYNIGMNAFINIKVPFNIKTK
ncbi:MAG: TonB-dependent receptor [Bacteroidota bacterium]